MLKTIRAIYEKGVLRPLSKLALREKQEVRIAILDAGTQDLSAGDLARIAQEGGAFRFLDDPREDVYGPEDGEEV
jgi:predicted DNA-binding antitoxin AbrB/MazE fold protein